MPKIPGKLIVIVGLPGSGKSTLIEEMQPLVTGLCVHDFHANAVGDSSLVDRSRYYHAVIDHIRAGNDCVIADIAFCEPPRRASLCEAFLREIPNLVLDWIYFENAPEKCERNVRRRERQSICNDLRELFRLAPLYRIPYGETPRVVREDGLSCTQPVLP
jgi:energy-coupling factor transporter ATP-binding protein EcfA2